MWYFFWLGSLVSLQEINISNGQSTRHAMWWTSYNVASSKIQSICGYMHPGETNLIWKIILNGVLLSSGEKKSNSCYTIAHWHVQILVPDISDRNARLQKCLYTTLRRHHLSIYVWFTHNKEFSPYCFTGEHRSWICFSHCNIPCCVWTTHILINDVVSM